MKNNYELLFLNQKIKFIRRRAFGLDSSSVKLKISNGAPCPEKLV
jgi:hypothetical protein